MSGPPARLRVGIIGAGRVGAALGAALARAGHDIVAVTRYLNERYYGFKPPGARPLVLTPAAKPCEGSRC